MPRFNIFDTPYHTRIGRNWDYTVDMIEVHAEGEVGRLVVSGFPEIPGQTMLEKMTYLNSTGKRLREPVVFEPRGAAQMSTNILLPSYLPDTEYGFIILQPDRAHAMSGSNVMCVVTALLESGLIPMDKPEILVPLETPAGRIKARATCTGNRCQSVALDAPPSFVDTLGYHVHDDSFGSITIDIAFGGVYYALVDVNQFDVAIIPENARKLVDIGTSILRVLRNRYKPRHPEEPAIEGISYTMFIDTSDDGTPVGATVLPPGRVDRSPCGTGNCARLAVRHARNQCNVGDSYTATSIIGSTFTVTCLGTTVCGGKPAVLPRIQGRAWVHGYHRIGHDHHDPYPNGFLLSDTWGEGSDLLLSTPEIF